MKRVLLDCDGVLSSFIEGALAHVANVTGRRYATADVTEFDFCAALKLSPDEARSVKAAISTSGFCAALSPFPEALDGMKRIRAAADIYVVTSPWNSNPTWMSEREAWLKRYFGIPHSRVVHTSAKHLVKGDILVDDKGSTLVEWKAEHPLGLAVHWDTPHNQREQVIGAIRVTSWDELAEIVEA